MPTSTTVVAAPVARTRRIGRWHSFIRGAYRVIYSFLGLNILAGIIQSFITAGGAAIPTGDQLQQVYLVQVAEHQPQIFWPVVVALAFIGIAGPSYDRWLTAEEQIAAEAADRARAQEEAHGVVDALATEVVAPIAQRVNALEAAQARALAAPVVPDVGPPFDLLPAAPIFVGRATELAQVRALLRGGQVAGITAVRGVGGIGKTALAAQVMRELRDADAFPDGMVARSLEQVTTEDGALNALRAILTRFDAHRQPPEATDWPGLAETARRLLAGKRTLVVLDNVEPNLPPATLQRLVGTLREAGAALLLTARQEVPRQVVPAEASLTLDVLPEDQAIALFAQAFAPQAPDPAVAGRIVRALGRHTLAVQLVAGYAADTRAGDLPQLAAELAANPRLALAIQGDDPQRDLEPVFASSFHALAPGGAPPRTIEDLVPAQRLFVALAAFGTAECGRRAALALGEGLGLDASEADNALTLLVRRALLTTEADPTLPEEADRVRLRLHPLMRAFAAERLDVWPAAEQERARRAIATFYADYANATLAPALVADEANIAAALEWAHAQGEDALVVRLCMGMRNFWRDRSRTAQSARYLPWGIAAAEAIANQTKARDDRSNLASLARAYGTVLSTIGQTDEAERAFTRSRAIFQEIGETRSAAIALSDLGDIQLRRGDVAAAEAAYQQSLTIRRQVQDTRGEAIMLSKLGDIQLQRGDVAAAEAAYAQYRQIMHQVGDQREEGVALSKLAVVAERLGNLDRAEEMHRASLAIGETVEDQRDIADSLVELGRFWIQRRGQRQEGCAMLQRAVQLYDQMGMPQAQDARDLIRDLGCGA